MRYVRECGKCYCWAESNDPKEEKVFRTCPTCNRGMFLLGPPMSQEYPRLALGKKIDLPPAYKAPDP